MFNIGDKIFYPMQGAGIVEAIEERDFLGEKKTYYIVNIPSKKMTVMIPKGKEEELHIRKIMDQSSLEKAITTFINEEPGDENIHPNQRHRVYLDKIKSGDFLESAKVIRDLLRISKTKNLGTADKNMLMNAQQILISELIMIKGFDENEANEYLENVFNA
jgi:CarD family transcriptional regulator